MSKSKEPIELYSTVETAKALGKTKQWVHWAMKNITDFPKPFATINKYTGWKKEEIHAFREKMQNGSGETKQAEKVENK
ncbi:hypothetical protein P4661_27595 [Priestia megaterium]|uniref:hypothetical protein n=1 Tax=Priestia megaterium TaxID=1404 RepID=UPI002E1FAB4E|nr:hypothetical protein [Priestia megaterium]